MEYTFKEHVGELAFDRDKHVYTVGGDVIPSVTTVLKEEGLVQYVENDSSGFAMKVGTWVHEAIEMFEKGDLDMGSLLPGMARYMESWSYFKAASMFEPAVPLIEKPLYHSLWRYAGTPDVPGTINGTWVLADVKTGVPRAGDLVQVAAYAEMLKNCVVELGAEWFEGMVVYLNDRGTPPKVVRIPVLHMLQNLDAFRSALTLNRWKRSNL